jgi:hypothetical protein
MKSPCCHLWNATFSVTLAILTLGNQRCSCSTSNIAKMFSIGVLA